MKSVEFMYWLQGPLEVGYIESLNPKQLQTIKNHLAMAFLTEGTKVQPFCMWLQGFLDANDSDALSPSQTEKIINKLNQCFEHAVPSFKQNNTQTTPQNSWPPSYLDEEMLKPVRC